MRTIIAAVIATACVLPASAQDAVVTTTHVAGNVYMLEGSGGNIGVTVGDDGVILVDDQMEPVLAGIRAAIAELSKGELRFIINTHFHGDHVGNNAALGKDATIIAHDNVRRRLMTPEEMSGETREPLDPAGWPVITFDESVSIHFNGEEIRVLHLPAGHTDGDAAVYFTGSNVLHAGDQLFSRVFPFVDLEHGGTIDGFVANLERLIAEVPADARVIPGHGPLSTVDDLRASRDMIRETVKIVRGRMEAGKSLDEIKAEGLPDKYASYDWSFIPTERWIETIYNGYSK